MRARGGDVGCGSRAREGRAAIPFAALGTQLQTGEGGAGLTWQSARARAGVATCSFLRAASAQPKWGVGDQGGKSEQLLPESCSFRGHCAEARRQKSEVWSAGSARVGCVCDLPLISLRLIGHTGSRRGAAELVTVTASATATVGILCRGQSLTWAGSDAVPSWGPEIPL